MGDDRTILFLCPHNAAKSVIASAYFERLAAERGLTLRATSAGTGPDPGVSPGVAGALLAEGIDVRGHRPRRVTAEELARASRVVSLGCDLGDLAPPGLVIERWNDVPSPSANLAGARAVIAAHVSRLVDTETSDAREGKERRHEMDHA
jgi:arsenate reductase (thioredoxin)